MFYVVLLKLHSFYLCVFGVEIIPDRMAMFDIHLRKLHRMYCPGLAGMKGNDQADRLMVKSYHKKLASRKI